MTDLDIVAALYAFESSTTIFRRWYSFQTNNFSFVVYSPVIRHPDVFLCIVAGSLWQRRLLLFRGANCDRIVSLGAREGHCGTGAMILWWSKRERCLDIDFSVRCRRGGEGVWCFRSTGVATPAQRASDSCAQFLPQFANGFPYIGFEKGHPVGNNCLQGKKTSDRCCAEDRQRCDLGCTRGNT